MIIKRELFIVMVTAIFVIGLLTILSFDGGSSRTRDGIPSKWKTVGLNVNNIDTKQQKQQESVEEQETTKIINKKDANIKHRLPRGGINNPFNKIDKNYQKNEKLNIQRADKVKEAMKYAWESYKEHGWGHDEWRPIENRTNDWLGGYGLTIIDSLDTLQIMGLLDEVQEGKEWVSQLLIEKETNERLSVFESTIRYLAAYLAMYDLTKERFWKEKAIEFGDLLMHSFKDNEPFPMPYLNPYSKETRMHSWSGGCVILSELGTMSMEFSRLTDISGDRKYKEKADQIQRALMKMNTSIKGLYPIYIRPDCSGFCTQQISIGAMGDSYYEYLLKMWIYTDGEEEYYSNLFVEAGNSIIDHLYKVSPGGDGYISTYEGGHSQNKQEHLTCFIGGVFALAAASNIGGNEKTNKIYMEIGEEVTKTCAKTYLESPTGLGGEIFIFERDGSIRQTGPGTVTWYLLRPETVESLFILYRLTGDQKYQDWGWKIFEAIEKNCRLPNGYGYAGLKDISNPNYKDPVQQSFFMAETLKYLYLLFKDSKTIPLDKYVFNTEAHPFLIQY